MVAKLQSYKVTCARRGLWRGAIGLLGLLVAEAAQGVAPEYKQIEPGLEYAHMVVTNKPWSIHVARLDLSRKNFDITATLAKGRVQGLETVAEQARSVSPAIGRAVAAVNGDFFVMRAGPYEGDPRGLQIAGGELVSAPGEVSLWISSGKPRLEQIVSRFRVVWPDDKDTSMGLNESTEGKGVVLFTPTFGVSTRATNTTELVLEPVRKGAWLPLRVNQEYRARVKAVNFEGDSKIEAGTTVLSIADLTTIANHLNGIGVGSVIELSTRVSKNLSRATAGIGGGPLLVAGGKSQQSRSVKRKSTYVAARHPRTAVGYGRRYFFLVEVDGRQPELSIGMDLAELAELMKDLGCTDAMNLDGGGSATFWLEGNVMNSPSDKHERAVANAVVVVKKR